MKNKPQTKLIANILFLVIILALLFYVVQNSLGEIVQNLFTTSLPAAVAVVVLGFFTQWVEGKSIEVMVKDEDDSFNSRDGFLTTAYATFYRIITFGAGTIVSEILFYRKKGIALSTGTGLVAIRTMLYKVAVIVTAAIGLLFYGGELRTTSFGIPLVLFSMILTTLIIAAILGLVFSRKFQRFLNWLGSKVLRNERGKERLAKGNEQIEALRLAFDQLLKQRHALHMSFLFQLLKLIFWYLLLYIVLLPHATGLPIGQTFAFAAFAVLLAGIIPAPAGLGSFEFVFVVLMRPFVGTAEAAAAVLLYRFATLIMPFLIGFGYVLVEKRRQIKIGIHELQEETESIKK